MPAKTSRSAGCFLVFFFGIFAIMPASGFIGIFFGDAKVTGSFAAVVTMMGVFFLIGIIGLYFGIRMLLGLQKTSAVTTKDQAIPGPQYPRCRRVKPWPMAIIA